MNKKALILAVFLLIILATGAGVWQWENQKKMDTERQVVSEKQAEQSEIDMRDWKTYKNEEYGFEIKLPGNIDKWSIEKKVFPKKNNVFNGDTITLYLKYDLDQNIPRVKNDPTLGVLANMSLWYINIIPMNIWRQDICSSAKIEGPCRQGTVLGKNALYVFESGFPNVESGICPDLSNSQKEYCGIAREIDNNVTEKLDFKFMNN